MKTVYREDQVNSIHKRNEATRRLESLFRNSFAATEWNDDIFNKEEAIDVFSVGCAWRRYGTPEKIRRLDLYKAEALIDELLDCHKGLSAYELEAISEMREALEKLQKKYQEKGKVSDEATRDTEENLFLIYNSNFPIYP